MNTDEPTTAESTTECAQDTSPVVVDEESLVKMEQLLEIQREHLKVRESHMDLMREAMADLALKRAELVDLKSQVSEAIKRNDINAVNEIHSQVSILQESQSKYAEMLVVSRDAARVTGLDDFTGDDDEDCSTLDTNALAVEGDDDEDEIDGQGSAVDADLSDFISLSLSSLMQEISSIDASTENTPEAEAYVLAERDMLITQLEELQRFSAAANEKRRLQIEELESKKQELEEFKKRIIELEGDLSENAENLEQAQIEEPQEK